MWRILVVDDEQAITEVLQELLADEGYMVMAASNGREALVCLADGPLDMVLSDVMMPIMDGVALCQAMAADGRYSAIPVVLMSAVGERRVREQCHYAAFVDKPFSVLEVLDTIARVLGEVTGR